MRLLIDLVRTVDGRLEGVVHPPGADVGRSSYLMAAGMLVSTTLHPALLLVFPGWVALAGLIVASRTGRSGVRTSPRSRP